MPSEVRRAAVRSRVRDLCAALPEVTVEDGQHIADSRCAASALAGFSTTTTAMVGSPSPARRRRTRTPRSPGAIRRASSCPPIPPRGGGLLLNAGAVDWDELERLAVEAYLLAAPKRLGASVRES